MRRSTKVNPDDICAKCDQARSYAQHCKDCGGKAYHRFFKKKVVPLKGLEIAAGVYRMPFHDPEHGYFPGGITETVDLQSGNQSEDCWIFEATEKWDGKRVKLLMVLDE